MRRRRGALTPEELALWREVATAFAPLRGRVQLAPSAEEKPVEAPPTEVRPVAPAPPPIARKAAKPPPPLAGVETRLRRRVARGQAAIDARLDLHGLYQADAHRRLFAFLARAQASGARLVLVITGKGRSGGDRDETGFHQSPGVLRRAVPTWLSSPEARPYVVGFEEAPLQHGGSGALYVRMRRPMTPL